MPVCLLASLFGPGDNAVTRGIRDGAQDASEQIDRMLGSPPSKDFSRRLARDHCAGTLALAWLEEMGYPQELARRLGGFSNFALSFSIICILAGGVTSFHVGFCSVGGASIGLGWPLAALFALGVGSRWDN